MSPWPFFPPLDSHVTDANHASVEFSIKSTKQKFNTATGSFYLTPIPPVSFLPARSPFSFSDKHCRKFSLSNFITPICPALQKTKRPLKKNPHFLLQHQALDASGHCQQSSNYFVGVLRFFFPILLLILFPPLEQEKANKEKAAKDKAYQEAIRAQQREEEFIGFRKPPARGSPQGHLIPFSWAVQVWP
jgi:hypothetical protein